MQFKPRLQHKTVVYIASVGKVAVMGWKWFTGRYNDSLWGISKEKAV